MFFVDSETSVASASIAYAIPSVKFLAGRDEFQHFVVVDGADNYHESFIGFLFDCINSLISDCLFVREHHVLKHSILNHQ